MQTSPTVQLLSVAGGIAQIQRDSEPPVTLSLHDLHEAAQPSGVEGYVCRWLMQQYALHESLVAEGVPWRGHRFTIAQIVADLQWEDAVLESRARQPERDAYALMLWRTRHSGTR
jgi:hypothetical protein